jgi:hypothetical protein
MRHADVMDDDEIKRLRKEIHRTFGSSPHKKKYWVALLEMYGDGIKGAITMGRSRCPGLVLANSFATIVRKPNPE